MPNLSTVKSPVTSTEVIDVTVHFMQLEESDVRHLTIEVLSSQLEAWRMDKIDQQDRDEGFNLMLSVTELVNQLLSGQDSFLNEAFDVHMGHMQKNAVGPASWLTSSEL